MRTLLPALLTLAALAHPAMAQELSVQSVTHAPPSIFDWTERPATAARTRGIERGPVAPRPREGRADAVRPTEDGKPPKIEIGGSIYTGFSMNF